MKILVVDDDDFVVQMLERTLSQAGHEVYTASNGVKALEILGAEKVRFVISDWLMPGIDGLELCRRVRSGAFPEYVYFILLTTQNTIDDIVKGLSVGADDFVTKPFNPAELLMRVKAGERVVSLETRHVAIFALAKLTESRDPETGYHLERIRTYSRLLATHITEQEGFNEEMSADYVETIFLTSPLHDIGKVGIPDFVLLKPGRLSDKEFDLMKKHSEIGGDTLSAAVSEYPGVEYLRMATDIARHHHERFDGGGYPDKIAGMDIPLSARIVALADVYDALISKRVYKAAMPHDMARNIIIEERGKQFDPNVVDTFLAKEELFVACYEAFPEKVDRVSNVA